MDTVQLTEQLNLLPAILTSERTQCPAVGRVGADMPEKGGKGTPRAVGPDYI